MTEGKVGHQKRFEEQQAEAVRAMLPEPIRRHWSIYVRRGMTWVWELRCGPLPLYRWDDDGIIRHRCTCASMVDCDNRSRSRFDWGPPTGVSVTPVGAVRAEVRAVRNYFDSGHRPKLAREFAEFFRSVGL